ncbi:hypothetical protein [uncultured Methylobacterium sp.]|uniref:Uncharacterized protein n=1 Tax=Methylobacterium symbioticum TaxID=2584084 RepID=A0A509E8M9_9HYPH|nr:hypothetical protein [uncultured Methylobacterium sp.]VUD70014.1 hypothetical protein MET9862_00575 [Methylobacterium symbioticum]
MNLALNFNLGFEINGRDNYVRLYRADCELWPGRTTATVMWG